MSIQLLSQDPAWSDVVPIAQVDVSNALVPILYSLEYSDAMNYFRAVVASDERSERALDVTLRVIKHNPAHYTVWQYRFKTLIELGKDLEDELDLMTALAEDNMKSYQVWHHRLLLLTHLPAPISTRVIQAELRFISESLSEDQKNYHTWAYRQFVLSHFGGALSDADWAEEERWVGALLAIEDDQIVDGARGDDVEADWVEDEGEDEVLGGQARERGDVRNNSAWGHRWFLMFGRAGAPGMRALTSELEYTVSQIEVVPNNSSSWNYLRGIHKFGSVPLSSQLLLAEKLSSGPSRPCSNALEWRADCAEARGDGESAREIFDRLKELDPVRKQYWSFRQSAAVSQA